MNDTELIDLDKVYGNPEVSKVTGDYIKKIYPVKINDSVANECAEVMNKAMEGLNTVEMEQLRDSMISVIDVLQGIGNKKRPTFQQYVNAVKFCNYKMMGHSDTRAYALTFPEKVQQMVNEKVPQSHLYSYANIYAKTDVVIAVQTKMMIPTHILYQDYFAQAVKTQVEIMNDDNVSPKVRSDAANSLMTHLKQPEIKKAEIEINTKDTGVIGDLANALANLSAGQREMMLQGKTSIKDITEAVIIEVEKDETLN